MRRLVPNLLTVFQDTVRRFGDRVAVEVQRESALERWTYQALSDLTMDRAVRLRQAGVGPGDRVAILAHNDAHWCAAYLAILARGAVAVPFDTNYSAAQVAAILRDSGARVMFASRRLSAVADEALADLSAVACLDVHEAAGDAPGVEAADAEGRALAPSAPAVILYTSGTTSDPKGVVLSHGNLLAERDAAFAVVSVRAEDSVLGVLPLFHSLAQLANLLLPFAVGARVVYLETLSSQELVRALSERAITIFACVPQFFYLIHERILREVGKRGLAARVVFRLMVEFSFAMRRLGLNIGPQLFGRVHRLLGRQMRLFVTGGSRFDPVVGRDLYALGFTILQAYGLTETSGAATINTPHDAHIDTVGRPLPGVEVKIVPPEPGGGEALDGEIAIRGPIVMQGYYARPDATSAVLQDGWLLTGDLGRLDGSGRLTITGRKKEVIILANGKNIYPEEVEAHYRTSAFVKEICVTTVAASDKPAGERLYAVVVPDMEVLAAKKIVNAGDLLRFELEGLGATLPSYKRVLGYEISFEPLPRTTTGKLKRHEIVKRLASRSREARGVEATESDRAWLADPHVAAALAIVRKRAAPGSACLPASNLELDLGLDSMARVEILAELEQYFAVEVSEERAHRIFTLGELVEEMRGGDAAIGARQTADGQESWAAVLGDLPPASDPVLGGLLERRPVIAPLLFVLGRTITRVLARVEVSGIEKLPADGAYLLCPNHQSYLDGFFVHGVLPYRAVQSLFFVGAVEYFETPVAAWAARQINCVPVDPDSNLVPAMKAGAFGLARGKVLMLFPEGERSIDGAVKRFKKGAPILARHAGVPIVPVGLAGPFELWPRAGSFRWGALLPWRRRTVSIRFGDPMRVRDGETDADAADRLRDAVAALIG